MERGFFFEGGGDNHGDDEPVDREDAGEDWGHEVCGVLVGVKGFFKGEGRTSNHHIWAEDADC